ncbi:MAG: NADH-quinone oxidoreductase subunit H [Desulfovibrio sp.]|nr:NADH-quinone oxidoreductase subunit H [Desulfovibrio sp.]
MSQPLLHALHFVLALLLSPLLFGIINRVKAKVAGRHGKPLLQTYFDLIKLLRKGCVRSDCTTPVFTLAPCIQISATVLALYFLPLGGVASPAGFAGDFLLVSYLLAAGRFVIMLAALDTGSSFEGMGASREATFSAFAEPVLFLAMIVLTSFYMDLGHSEAYAFSLGTLFGGQSALAWLNGKLELLFIPPVFFLLLLVENSRIPVDDPTTHLELTMIHEVMILDHSGPDLALILYASTVKLWFFASLIASLFIPPMQIWQESLLWLLLIFLLAVILGLLESSMARLRLHRVPALIGAAGMMAALALILSQMR